MQSIQETHADLHKKYPKVLQKKQIGCSNKDQKRHETQTLQMDLGSFHSIMSGSSNSRNHDTDQYIPKGCGLQINQMQFLGEFNQSMSFSVNVLELLTIWYALLIPERNKTFQVLCDNTTAV